MDADWTVSVYRPWPGQIHLKVYKDHQCVRFELDEQTILQAAPLFVQAMSELFDLRDPSVSFVKYGLTNGLEGK